VREGREPWGRGPRGARSARPLRCVRGRRERRVAPRARRWPLRSDNSVPIL